MRAGRPHAAARDTDHGGTHACPTPPAPRSPTPACASAGRPQAPGRPARVPGRGPGRRRRHRAAARQGMEAAEELEHLAVFADACARHGKLLAVNDRADVAHAARADVLHLGQGDLPVPAARADPRRRGADRPLHARRGRGRRCRRPGGRGLLLHRPLLAHPHQARPPRPPASAWSVTRPAWAPTAPGSPSAASTSATWTRCWRRAPAGSSWSARSPRRPTRVRRRASSPSGCARRSPRCPRFCPRGGQEADNSGKFPTCGWGTAHPWLTCPYGPRNRIHQD